MADRSEVAALATAGFAAARIALGLGALVAPGPAARAFGLGDSPTMRVAARHLAGRDLVGGLGILMGTRHGRARGWLEAAALIDVIDTGVALLAGATGAMPPRRALLVAVVAGASGGAALVLARQSPDSSSSSSTASAS